MRKRTVALVQEELQVDVTLHSVSATLLSEFTEKIVRPYYRGSLNSAVQDLIQKALSEQEFVLSHITHIRDQRPQ